MFWDIGAKVEFWRDESYIATTPWLLSYGRKIFEAITRAEAGVTFSEDHGGFYKSTVKPTNKVHT